MKTNLSSNPQYLEAIAVQDKLTEALRNEQNIEAGHAERLNLHCVAPGQQLDEVERALDTADGRPAPAGNAALTDAIRASQGKQSVLQAGIERQQQRLADLVGQLSADYCQARRAEHLAILEQLHNGLEQARAAIEAEDKLRNDIQGNGYRDMLPGLHQLTFEQNSPEAIAVLELAHYMAIHGGKLSKAKKVSGIALRNFEAFGASGVAGQTLTVDEVTAELLRYNGMLDLNGSALKAARAQQLAGIAG